jgi:hypothetical protein
MNNQHVPQPNEKKPHLVSLIDQEVDRVCGIVDRAELEPTELAAVAIRVCEVDDEIQSIAIIDYADDERHQRLERFQRSWWWSLVFFVGGFILVASVIVRGLL